MRTLALALACLFVGGLAVLILRAQAQPGGVSQPDYQTARQTIVVGIDLSRSNPLIYDEVFAAKVGERVRPMIEGMAPRSRVMLRSFGSYDSSANAILSLDILVAPKDARAEDIALLVSNTIASVPRLVKQRRVHAQNSTNIVPFLSNMARVVDCRAMPTFVVLASDGIEDSQVANLKRRQATLPAPQIAPFPGCEELVILGIGQGLQSPADTERLYGEWQFWAQAAGFKRFTGLNDW